MCSGPLSRSLVNSCRAFCNCAQDWSRGTVPDGVVLHTRRVARPMTWHNLWWVCGGRRWQVVSLMPCRAAASWWMTMLMWTSWTSIWDAPSTSSAVGASSVWSVPPGGWPVVASTDLAILVMKCPIECMCLDVKCNRGCSLDHIEVCSCMCSCMCSCVCETEFLI